MKKHYILIVMLLINAACTSTKKSMDSWVGKTKQIFIKTLGPPVRTLQNADGEILIYADQVYKKADNTNGSPMHASNNWEYLYVYVNNEGKVTYLRNEKQNFPPQQIDASLLKGTNAISAK
ncbi:hypothetical protein D0809_13175 [Flavobacterium circumlabens]|uniref:Uncharacterized protein n=2 Tax=Flavobacterium circumlabens TaxID=2133765 RepID=A0A4Y7UBM8_9FLAO|nr:hypothetical protein [Flavobacterium circumlabens]TEB43840.1 hypothetical protein D0809_13175 [Flavobacterium circumlabens]